MRVGFVSISAILICMFGTFNREPGSMHHAINKNIMFNHLFVVIDDSTYRYLFNSPALPENFAAVKEQTTEGGIATWTGKYFSGVSNYLEFFKAGGNTNGKLGDLGLGFTTNKLGTLDSLQHYW